MKIHTKNIRIAVLTAALAASPSVPPAAGAAVQKQCSQIANKVKAGAALSEEEKIEQRDCRRNGITVEEPKVYDDALLQQMLQAAEARLAAIQLLDQSGIAAKLGAVTGASQQISSFGLNVQGPSLPEVGVTSKGPTGSTEETDTTNPTGTTTVFKTSSGLGTQDVATKRAQVNPPPLIAAAPSTAPSTSFSVSASDILNEQAQLTAEIAALRLLIRGSLSDHFVRGLSETNETKKKVTLGFPITIIPDKRYKDAVAVVEVAVGPPTDEERIKIEVRAEVDEENKHRDSKLSDTEVNAEVAEKVKRRLEVAPPAVTALLPREKTYNVASITDKSVSIGGGVATQILGVSGSWLRGHKTYYLVQDQDTVALSFRPEVGGKVGFMWQFRPVLGREYAKAGLKQTFVQLAFVAPDDADTVGRVTVRTYWRGYDRKRGITQNIIPNSFQEHIAEPGVPIRTYALAKKPPTFNPRDHLEDLGGGQLLVRVDGRYLPGTYVRIGSTILTPGPQFTHEHEGIRFIAPLSDLVTKEPVLVAHDGTEVPLRFALEGCKAAAPIVIDPNSLRVETVDEANSRLTLEVNEPEQEKKSPPRVIVIGSRVFGYSDAPVQRKGKALSAVVPNALLSANPSPRIWVQTLFPQRGCKSDPVAAPRPISPERLAVLERDQNTTTFLLSGTRLGGIRVLSPVGAVLGNVGAPSDPDRLVSLTLTSDHLKTNKQVFLQRNGERPFLVNIPELDPKKPDPPKARERVTVDADEAVIEGDGMRDLSKVFFRNAEITSREIAADGKSVRLSGLRVLRVTSTAASQPLVLEFKSGAKVTVTLEVVNTKVETVTK